MEYALVLGAVMAIVVALGVLLNVLDAGVFVEHTLAAASHHVRASYAWAIDVFCY